MNKDPKSTEQLRAQAAFLLSEARSQAADIRRALSNVGKDQPLHGKLEGALAQVSAAASAISGALSSSVFSLSAGDLMALGGAVEAEGGMAAEATQETTRSVAAGTVTLAAANTRGEVQSLSRDVFDRHIFDRYLHFTSDEDKEEFRKRTAESQRYVNEQLARGTPEVDLNAAGGMQSHMLDLQAHGAGDSPEFMPRWNKLADKTRDQHTAMRDAGQSTDEYDRHVNASVRSFLKAKGLSDAEIDKRLAGSADALDAVKPFLQNDGERDGLKAGIQRTELSTATEQLQSRVGAQQGASTREPQLGLDFAAMDAKLRAVGLRLPPPLTNSETPDHGLSAQNPVSRAGPAVGD